MTENRQFLNGYSEVNGIKMYYKVSGEGEPLMPVHGVSPFEEPVPTGTRREERKGDGMIYLR